MSESVYTRIKATLAGLALAACMAAMAPVHAKIEPLRSSHPGLVDPAAQATPPPGERAPASSRDDAVMDDGDSRVTWAVTIVILLGAIAAVAWWWPKFQRSRADHSAPITPSRGPAQSDRDPRDRGD